ncbi:galactokinase [Corynebacterium sp. 3HC-13]|uniref:galactokinase n=1 Tax=Corynebacterium poyangense TaxID=2684405 RepID=UPI001CCD4746|nr:galactokinase [Corynebacterium poyangense]MBZ8178001.1 galactokinase [Corynebacterium poyangense]
MSTPHWLPNRTSQEACDAALRNFERSYGYSATGVWAAPGRVNLIGEHVDYAGGICLPFALEQSTYVAISPRDDDTIRIESWLPSHSEPAKAELRAGNLGPGEISGWLGYALGPIWALREAGLLSPSARGYDVAIVSDVPLGSGLSSSAAIECAVASAVVELEKGDGALADDATRTAIIQAAIRAENEVVGASTGGLDQNISLQGKSGFALAIDFSTGQSYHVPCDLESHDLAILVIDSNAPHSLADGQYASRRGIIDAVTHYCQASTLRDIGDDTAIYAAAQQWATSTGADPDCTNRRVRHVVTEISRTLDAIESLKRADFQAFGCAMYASHKSLKEDYEVTVPQLDLIVDTAKDYGAIGARMTGGGFGGSAIALVPRAEVHPMAQAISRSFAQAEFAPPAFLQATPSPGARRER